MLTEQAEQLEYVHEDHRVASVAVHDGAVSVHASGGDPLRATEMKAVFDRAVEVEFDRDCVERRRLHGDDALAHPLPRTSDQRRFDAMYDMFMAWATVPAGGVRPEPLVNFIIDPTTGIETLIRHGFLDDITDANSNTDTNSSTATGNTATGNTATGNTATGITATGITASGSSGSVGLFDPSARRCGTSMGTRAS